ncbi:hypothetical protein ACLB2K_052366 [Fragaria x ananassa]
MGFGLGPVLISSRIGDDSFLRGSQGRTLARIGLWLWLFVRNGGYEIGEMHGCCEGVTALAKVIMIGVNLIRKSWRMLWASRADDPWKKQLGLRNPKSDLQNAGLLADSALNIRVASSV